MWLSGGTPQCWRDRQQEFCLNAVTQTRIVLQRDVSWKDAFELYPDGKIGDYGSPWHASRGRISAMIRQLNNNPLLTEWFADVDYEEYTMRVSKVDRRKSHSNPFGRIKQ